MHLPSPAGAHISWQGWLIGALLALAVGLAPAAGPAVAAGSRPCQPPKYPGLGYFTSLTVSGVTCATGGKVAVAYYHCRLRGGHASGHCFGKVDGYACTEHRMSIATEIDARVTCRRGRLTVVHTYQQTT
jgi:hypothetical protein